MAERAVIVDILSNFLDFKRNRTGKSIILFLVGLISVSWIASSLYGFFDHLAKGIWYLIGAEKLRDNWWWGLGVTGSDVIVALFVFYLVYRTMRRHLEPVVTTVPSLRFETPAPHQGLILLLSIYQKRECKFDTFDKISVADPDVRKELLKSNWGPLVVAVQHHAQKETLKYCWLLCTGGEKGSALQFDVAAKIIKHFAGEQVICHKQEISNLNDVDEVAKTVGTIYEKARLGEDLLPEHILADFTGGTAAMSGGLLIAALSNNRQVEYFSQDPQKPIFKTNQEPFTPAEIAAANVLITITLSPLVSEANHNAE
jgi:CRISPR-associated protein (Cas_Cas02710)